MDGCISGCKITGCKIYVFKRKKQGTIFLSKNRKSLSARKPVLQELRWIPLRLSKLRIGKHKKVDRPICNLANYLPL